MSTAAYHWTLYWPGLSRLWLRGDGWAFLTAVLFGLVVNFLLVTTFVWPRLLGSAPLTQVFNSLGWFAVLCFWGVCMYDTKRLLPRLLPGAESRGDDTLFSRAQTEYLQGDWYAAEKRLIKLLREAPRDADAHLLLAGVYRRSRRNTEAENQLRFLEHLEGGGKWLFEIDEERRRLAQNAQPTDDTQE